MNAEQSEIPSGSISQWDDSSGNARHLTQGTAASRPSGTAGSHATFDGVDDHLSIANTGLTLSDINLFLLRRAAASELEGVDFSSGFSPYGFAVEDGSTSTALYAGIGSPTIYKNGAAFSPTTRDDVHTGLNTGNFELVEYIGMDLSGLSADLDFMRFPSPASFNLAGDLAAVVFVSGPLSQANRERIEGRLLWDAGLQANLPSGHPYKSSAP